MTEIVVSSPAEIAAKLRNLADKYGPEVANALFLELAKVLRASQIICPVDTGHLRGSGHVTDPVVNPGSIEAEIGYSMGYAWWVHEILDNYHKPPTQAKYLEQPLLQALPTMQENITKRVEALIAEG